MRVDLAGHTLLHRGDGGVLARFGKPAIFMTDQGCQFTSTAFNDVLDKAENAFAWTARAASPDNILFERLWRTIKCGDV